MVWRLPLRGAEGGSGELVWRLALETRRRSSGDGLADCVARGRGLTAGRGAGPWRGSAGHGGELGYRRSGRGAVASCLREIHLEPAIIDY